MVHAFGSVRVAFTGRPHGDFGLDAPGVDERRARVAGGRAVTWLRQVHGAHVVCVGAPGDAAGSEADGAVTSAVDAVLSVLTADCAPIVLWSVGGEADRGAIGIAHAGWKGVRAGLIERVIGVVRSLSAPGADVHALLGPCIHVECYEFGVGDLAEISATYGNGVRGLTATGSPALDLPAAVSAAVSRAGGVSLDPTTVAGVAGCTACDPGWFSWRARGERARQAAFVWRERHPIREESTNRGTA